jgi:hypothetical protein
MSDATTQERDQLSESRATTNGYKHAPRSSVERKREREAQQLDEAIEEDSAAIVRLLRSCASSRDFGVEQLREFQKLFRHRRRLIVRFERLQRLVYSQPKVPGEIPNGNEPRSVTSSSE